jgi:hypothetical protein
LLHRSNVGYSDFPDPERLDEGVGIGRFGGRGNFGKGRMFSTDFKDEILMVGMKVERLVLKVAVAWLKDGNKQGGVAHVALIVDS